MLTYIDFVITSTSCDYELFFNADYQRVVNKAIQELEKLNKWNKATIRKWELLCCEDTIRITDNHKNIYVNILDTYKKSA